MLDGLADLREHVLDVDVLKIFSFLHVSLGLLQDLSDEFLFVYNHLNHPFSFIVCIVETNDDIVR